MLICLFVYFPICSNIHVVFLISLENFEGKCARNQKRMAEKGKQRPEQEGEIFQETVA